MIIAGGPVRIDDTGHIQAALPSFSPDSPTSVVDSNVLRAEDEWFERKRIEGKWRRAFESKTSAIPETETVAVPCRARGSSEDKPPSRELSHTSLDSSSKEASTPTTELEREKEVLEQREREEAELAELERQNEIEIEREKEQEDEGDLLTTRGLVKEASTPVYLEATLRGLQCRHSAAVHTAVRFNVTKLKREEPQQQPRDTPPLPPPRRASGPAWSESEWSSAERAAADDRRRAAAAYKRELDDKQRRAALAADERRRLSASRLAAAVLSAAHAVRAGDDDEEALLARVDAVQQRIAAAVERSERTRAQWRAAGGTEVAEATARAARAAERNTADNRRRAALAVDHRYRVELKQAQRQIDDARERLDSARRRSDETIVAAAYERAIDVTAAARAAAARATTAARAEAAARSEASVFTGQEIVGKIYYSQLFK